MRQEGVGVAADAGSGPAADPGERLALIRVSSLAPVVEELDRRGGAADALLARHGLTRAQLADPYHEMALVRYVRFLEEAAAAAGDELLGARVGGQFRPAHLGPVGLLFGASATLRRGLERLARWLNVWQHGTAMRVWSEETTLVWSYRLDPGMWPRRQDTEYTLAATIALARAAFGAAGRPLEVDVEHAAPADPAPLARILGIRPSFGRPDNRLVFDRAEADRVQRAEDRDLLAILERHVADLCQPAPGAEGLIGKARTLVLMHLGARPITLPAVAAELNVSTRTLQRRLADEGTSLRALVRDCRLELGRLHLREGRISNAEIARALGYADSTAFWRAFKAGTGSAPSRYRRSG
jgi:AraC-like DNA-binding protein